MANISVNLVNLSEREQDFINSISSLEGCKFAHVVTETSVKIPKKYELEKVTKVTDKIVQLNYNYEKAVNNRLKKEGKEPNFTAQSLPWGEWIEPNKIITHKGSVYLRMYDFDGGLKNRTYFVDGKVANDKQVKTIEDYEKSKNKGSNTQQGLKNQVTPTAVNFDNIISLKCGLINYHRDKKKIVALAN